MPVYQRCVSDCCFLCLFGSYPPPPPHPLTLPAYYNKLTQCPRYNMEAA